LERAKDGAQHPQPPGRIKGLKTFIAWCLEKKFITANNIHTFTISTFNRPVFALTEKEILELYHFNYENKAKEI
jgi:hypothetical protein